MTELTYNHLSDKERFYIDTERRKGTSLSKIAAALSRPKSTISREIKRNSDELGTYNHEIAESLKAMRHQIKKKAIKFTEQIGWEITQGILKKFSPDQIVKSLNKQGKITVSVPRVYQFIRVDRANNGKLYQNLRRHHVPYLKGGKHKNYKGKITDRVSISERPKEVDDRSRVGDWEADTMVGKGHQGYLVTLTERKTLFNLAIAVANKEAETVRKAIEKALLPFKDQVHTITFDNGLEFAQHMKIAKTLDCKTYFADPYSSWQRGLNENHNGLLRQYFPKGMSLKDITQEQVDQAIAELNIRPRKKLEYESPQTVFFKLTGLV